MGDCGKPEEDKRAVLGGAHTFCPLIRPPRPPRPHLPRHPSTFPSHLRPPLRHRQSPSIPPFIQLIPLFLLCLVLQTSYNPLPPTKRPFNRHLSKSHSIPLNSHRFTHRPPPPRVVSFPWAAYYPTMTFPKASLNPLALSYIHEPSPLSSERSPPTICGKHASPSNHE